MYSLGAFLYSFHRSHLDTLFPNVNASHNKNCATLYQNSLVYSPIIRFSPHHVLACVYFLRVMTYNMGIRKAILGVCLHQRVQPPISAN